MRSAAHSVSDARALFDKYKGKPIDGMSTIHLQVTMYVVLTEKTGIR